ncbi:MAG: hypothetical protein KAG97_06820, partial [Victivallales bacterium]|nr:hypothetical protein [Victivallales bacterium]
MKTTTSDWIFPIGSCHAGIPLGNATMGLEVWGCGELLKLTIGRADFWDRRGGMKWSSKQNYRDIRDCLERNDEAGIKEIFASDTEKAPGQPSRPSIVPVGRLDISLSDGSTLRSGSLDVRTGLVVVKYERGGKLLHIEIQMDMESQLFHLEFPEPGYNVEFSPSWNHLSDYFQSVSMTEPEFFSK